jgi:hypothetical protein
VYKEVSGKHHKPHIHAEYADDEVVAARRQNTNSQNNRR